MPSFYKSYKFVKHIENHLKEMPELGDNPKVVCKICGKTIDEIFQDPLRSSKMKKIKKRESPNFKYLRGSTPSANTGVKQ